MSKNEKMIESFSAYCKQHPELRFWQALRNWTQKEINADANFLFVAPIDFYQLVEQGELEQAVTLLGDTFYWEDDKLGPPRD